MEKWCHMMLGSKVLFASFFLYILGCMSMLYVDRKSCEERSNKTQITSEENICFPSVPAFSWGNKCQTRLNHHSDLLQPVRWTRFTLRGITLLFTWIQQTWGREACLFLGLIEAQCTLHFAFTLLHPEAWYSLILHGCSKMKWKQMAKTNRTVNYHDRRRNMHSLSLYLHWMYCL